MFWNDKDPLPNCKLIPTNMKLNASKVIFVDDHSLIRDALAEIINGEDNFCVIGKASNGKELIYLLENGSLPHLIILDLNMPVMDGYETAEYLHINYPDIQIIVLTMFNSEVPLFRLLQKGVKGFIGKDILPEEFKLAINTVINKGYYYSNDATGKLGHLLLKSTEENNSFDKGLLNVKEIEFLKLVASDDTYKDIALKMGVLPRTVDHLRDGLFDKLDVKSRVGLVMYAVQNGIIIF